MCPEAVHLSEPLLNSLSAIVRHISSCFCKFSKGLGADEGIHKVFKSDCNTVKLSPATALAYHEPQRQPPSLGHWLLGCEGSSVSFNHTLSQKMLSYSHPQTAAWRQKHRRKTQHQSSHSYITSHSTASSSFIPFSKSLCCNVLHLYMLLFSFLWGIMMFSCCFRLWNDNRTFVSIFSVKLLC